MEQQNELNEIRDLIVTILVRVTKMVDIENLSDVSDLAFDQWMICISIRTDCIALLRFLDHALNKSHNFMQAFSHALSEFDATSSLRNLAELFEDEEQNLPVGKLEAWHQRFVAWIQPLLHDEGLMRSMVVYPIGR
jgi:hypothetical protein